MPKKKKKTGSALTGRGGYGTSRGMANRLAQNPAAFGGGGTSSPRSRVGAAKAKIASLTAQGYKLNPAQASRATLKGMAAYKKKKNK